MKKKRKPLGSLLPTVTEFPDPTTEQQDIVSAQWDAGTTWAGLLDAKPLDWTGTPEPLFRRDEIKGETIRVSDGYIVTADDLRAAMIEYMAGL